MTAVAAPTLTFFVRGNPVTKGSMIIRHRHGRYDARTKGCTCSNWPTEDNGARLKEWRELIATAAKNAMGEQPPFYGPLRVVTTFYFARPKAHTREQRAVPWVIVNKRHDIEKLDRAVYDAIGDAGNVWLDDSQVVSHDSQKVYAGVGEHPGVMVMLETLS